MLEEAWGLQPITFPSQRRTARLSSILGLQPRKRDCAPVVLPFSLWGAPCARQTYLGLGIRYGCQRIGACPGISALCCPVVACFDRSCSLSTTSSVVVQLCVFIYRGHKFPRTVGGITRLSTSTGGRLVGPSRECEAICRFRVACQRRFGYQG